MEKDPGDSVKKKTVFMPTSSEKKDLSSKGSSGGFNDKPPLFSYSDPAEDADNLEADQRDNGDRIEDSNVLCEFSTDFLMRNVDVLWKLKDKQNRELWLQEVRAKLKLTPEEDSSKKGVEKSLSELMDDDLVIVKNAAISGRSDVFVPYFPASMQEQSIFADWIANAKFPKKLKTPASVKKYGGLSDPDDHIFDFWSAARLEYWSEETLCHILVQTFTGAARVWYDSLPNALIESFEDLKSKFLKQFSQQRKCTKEVTEVHNIRRRGDESLEKFVVRFNNETMKIVGAQDQLRISGFCHGVRHSHLVEKLHEDLPKTMEVLMDRVRAYLKGKSASGNIQGVNTQKTPAKGANVKNTNANANLVSSKNQSWGRYRLQPYDRRIEGNFGGYKKNWDSRRDEYPSLTKTPSEILATEKVQFSTPQRRCLVTNMDTSKYYDFHKDRGHEIDECLHMRNEIEKTIKSGKLSHLVKNMKEGRPLTKAKNIIGMIRRGANTWHRSVRAKENEKSWEWQEITFPPLVGGESKEDPVVVTVEIVGFLEKRTYLDTGSASEIMYESCFKKMGLEVQKHLKPHVSPLVEFSGEVVHPIGEITLQVIFGDDKLFREVMMTFVVVATPSPYNVIIGRPGLKILKAIVSTSHGVVRFPTPRGVATVKTDVEMQIAMVEKPKAKSEVLKMVEGDELAKNKWVINEKFPEQLIEVGQQLQGKPREKLFRLLKSNVDIFAWESSDMTGVPKHFAEHRLNVYPGVKPVQQKRRIMDKIRNDVVKDEVDKLVDAGILREVLYQTWVANPVLVKKSDGTWRMCIEFKDLNKACPNDCYPLPETVILFLRFK